MTVIGPQFMFASVFIFHVPLLRNKKIDASLSGPKSIVLGLPVCRYYRVRERSMAIMDPRIMDASFLLVFVLIYGTKLD